MCGVHDEPISVGVFEITADKAAEGLNTLSELKDATEAQLMRTITSAFVVLAHKRERESVIDEVEDAYNGLLRIGLAVERSLEPALA